jgi:divalent metal cation (Fe/Co/Zn/Cd) transporter
MALYLRRTTEVATPTELIGSGLGVVGGLLALIALAVTQATGSMWPDPIASAAIGVALMLGAAALTQLNRSLLTGRGVPAKTLEQMRGVVEAQAGVVEVPDLFGIVVGPAMVAIDGDVTFADELDVPDVETAIGAIAGALRARWPEIRYVYLTPVGQRRDRHGALP